MNYNPFTVIVASPKVKIANAQMRVAHLKGYAGLRARDEFVVHGVVVELGAHEDITGWRRR